MKAVMLTGIRQMEIMDVPRPRIQQPTDVLLRVKMVGVCGSDVHYYETGRIGSQVVSYPYMVGHECAAVVEQVGPEVSGLKVGDEVVIEPAICCHECDQCRSGRENTCRNLKFLGCPGQLDGCMCEYIVMPAECCLATGGAITIQQGVLCEPLAIGYYAVKQSKIGNGQTAVILGAGPIGLSCLVAAKHFGSEEIYMTEIIPERIAKALEGGAKWASNPEQSDVVREILDRNPAGADVVYECAGKQETIDQAIELLKPGGTLMLIGIPREERVSFQIDRMRRKEITVINVRRQNGCTRAVMDMLAGGKVDADFMVTHHFGIEQSDRAFEMVAAYRDGAVKAMINF